MRAKKQSDLNGLLGIQPRARPQVFGVADVENVLNRKRAVQPCGFTWDREMRAVFMGQAYSETPRDVKLHAVGFNAGCAHDCSYCWARSGYVQFLQARLGGRPWNQPTYLPEVRALYPDEIGGYEDELVLFSNTSDVFGHPESRTQLRHVLCLALLANARPVVLTKGVPEAPPAAYFAEPPDDLLECLQVSRHPLWWGSTVTTLDGEEAAKIEPGAPPPGERVAYLQELNAWSTDEAGGRVKIWMSVNWHRHTDPARILEETHEFVRLYVLEPLHRRGARAEGFRWSDWLVPGTQLWDELAPLLRLAVELGVCLVLKDELRQWMIVSEEMRGLYGQMHGRISF
jgi:hypothetical protein